MFKRLGIVADVGGTNARFAIARREKTPHSFRLRLESRASFPSEGESFDQVFARYLDSLRDLEVPKRFSFAVAGPVHDGRVRFTNLPWELSERSLQKTFHAESCALLNDFEAIGYAVAEDHDDDQILKQGDVLGTRVRRAVLGAGTGLGECVSVEDRAAGRSIFVGPGEGGHVDFAPTNEVEWRFAGYLSKEVGMPQASWEDVLSGRGYVSLYQFLATECSGFEELSALPSAERSTRITERAAHGHADALQTIRMFAYLYGREGRNHAVRHAADELVIAGGIAGKLLPFGFSEAFLQGFYANPRMKTLVDRCRIRLLTHDDVGLIGAAVKLNQS